MPGAAALQANDKPVAAICHGPWMLCSARDAEGRPVVAGKRATCFVAIKDDVINAGAVPPPTPTHPDLPRPRSAPRAIRDCQHSTLELWARHCMAEPPAAGDLSHRRVPASVTRAYWWQIYTADEPCVVDGCLITAQTPKDLTAMCHALIHLVWVRHQATL